MAKRFAKAPAGIFVFIHGTKGFPQREAEGRRPRLTPWKDQRLVVSRSAVLPPRPSPALELLNFRKSWGIFYKALDINPRIDIISKQF